MVKLLHVNSYSFWAVYLGMIKENPHQLWLLNLFFNEARRKKSSVIQERFVECQLWWWHLQQVSLGSLWPQLGCLTSPCDLHHRNLNETHSVGEKIGRVYYRAKWDTLKGWERDRQWPAVHCRTEYIHRVTVTRKRLLCPYTFRHTNYFYIFRTDSFPQGCCSWWLVGRLELAPP